MLVWYNSLVCWLLKNPYMLLNTCSRILCSPLWIDFLRMNMFRLHKSAPWTWPGRGHDACSTVGSATAILLGLTCCIDPFYLSQLENRKRGSSEASSRRKRAPPQRSKNPTEVQNTATTSRTAKSSAPGVPSESQATFTFSPPIDDRPSLVPGAQVKEVLNSMQIWSDF